MVAIARPTYRIKTKYLDAICTINKATYGNGRIALQLVANGEPQARATVNIPEVDCPEGHAFIKSYSENEGMLEALVAAGVVSEPVAWIEGGHVTVPLCKVLI